MADFKRMAIDDVTVEEVTIDDDYIIEYVSGNFLPEKVFDKSDLGDWAERHGYVIEEEEKEKRWK